MIRLGVHLSIAPAFRAAAERAEAIGCESLQIFCGNPRGWAKKPLDVEQVARFRKACAQADLKAVVVHATYLINLAAPDELYQRSVEAFVEEVERARVLGASAYVVHPGSHRGAGAEPAARRVAAALDRACEAVPGPIRILLENTAGGRNVLGASFEELGGILGYARYPDRVGICLDSCHALAAGYDMRRSDGLAQALESLDSAVGLAHLGCLHVNDSQFDLGSRRDRHEHLGQGCLGERGLRAFLRHPAFDGLPGILETPQDRPDADRDNLDTAWRLAGRKRPRRSGGGKGRAPGARARRQTGGPPGQKTRTRQKSPARQGR